MPEQSRRYLIDARLFEVVFADKLYYIFQGHVLYRKDSNAGDDKERTWLIGIGGDWDVKGCFYVGYIIVIVAFC